MAQQVQYYGGRDPRPSTNYNTGYGRQPEPHYQPDMNRNSWSDQRPPPQQPPSNPVQYQQNVDHYDRGNLNNSSSNYPKEDRRHDESYNRNQYNAGYQSDSRYSEPVDRRPPYNENTDRNYNRNHEYNDDSRRSYPPQQEPPRQENYEQDYRQPERPRYQPQNNVPPRPPQSTYNQGEPVNDRNQQFGPRFNDYQRNNNYEREREQPLPPPPDAPAPPNSYNLPPAPSMQPRSPVNENSRLGQPQVLAQTTATSRGGAAVFGIVAKVGRPENSAPPSRSQNQPQQPPQHYNQPYRQDDRERSPVRAQSLAPIMEQPSPPVSPRYRRDPQYSDHNQHSKPQYERPAYDRPQGRKPDEYHYERPGDGYREDSSGYGSASTYNERPYDERPHYDQQQRMPQGGNRDYVDRSKPQPPPIQQQQGYVNQREENYGRNDNWNESDQSQPVFHQQNLKRHWTLQKKPAPPQKPVTSYQPPSVNREQNRNPGVDKTHVPSVQAAKQLFDKPSGPVPLPAPKAAYVGNQYSAGGQPPPRPRIYSDPDQQQPQSPTNRSYSNQMPQPPQHMSKSMNNLDRLQPPPSMPPQSRNSYSGEQPMVVGVRFENDNRKPQYNAQNQVEQRGEYYEGQNPLMHQRRYDDDDDDDYYQPSWQYQNQREQQPVEPHNNQPQPVYNQRQDTRPQQSHYNQPVHQQNKNQPDFERTRPEPPRDYNPQQPPRSSAYDPQPPQQRETYGGRMQDSRSPDYQGQYHQPRSPGYTSQEPPQRSRSPPFQGQDQRSRSPGYQSREPPQRSLSPPYQSQPSHQRSLSPNNQGQASHQRPRSPNYAERSNHRGQVAENDQYYQDEQRSNNFPPPSSQYQPIRETSQPPRQQPSQQGNQFEPQTYGAGDRRSAAEYEQRPQHGVESQRFPINTRQHQGSYQDVRDTRPPETNSQRNSYVPPPEGNSHGFIPAPRPGSPTYNTSEPRVAPQVSRPQYKDQLETRNDQRQVRFQSRPQQDRFEEEAQRHQSPDSEVSNYVPSIVARSYASFNQDTDAPQQNAPSRPTSKPVGRISDQQWPDPPPPITQAPPKTYKHIPQQSQKEENRSQYQTRQPPPGRDNSRILTSVPRHPFDPVDEDDDSSEGVDVDAPTPPPEPTLPKQWGSNQQMARRPDMQQRHIPVGAKKGYDRQPGDGLNDDRYESSRPQKQPVNKIPPNKPKRQSLRRNQAKQMPLPATKPEPSLWQDDDDDDSQNQLNHDHSKDRLRVAKTGRMLTRKPPTRQGSSSNLLTNEDTEVQDFAIEVTPNDLRKIRESPITVQEPSPEKPQKTKSSLKVNQPQPAPSNKHHNHSGDSRQKKASDEKVNSKLIFKVPSPETSKRPTAHPLPDLKEPVEGDKKRPPTYTGFGNTGKPKGNIGSDLLDQFKTARESALRNAAKKQDKALKAISAFQQKRNPSPVKSPTRKPETVADKNASKITKNSAYDENKDIYNRSKPKHYDRHSPDERSNRTSVKSSSTITGRRDSDSSSDRRGRSQKDRGRSRARSRSRDRDLSPNRHRGRSRSRERLESHDRRRGRSRSRERITSPDRRGRDHSRDRDLDREQRSRKSERYNQQVSPYKHGRDDPSYRSSHHHRGGSDEPEWVEQYRRRRNNHDDPPVHRRAWVNDPRWQKKEFDINEYERDVKKATSYNSDFEQPQRNQMFPAKLMQKNKPPPTRHPPGKNEDWMRNLQEKNRKAAQRRYGKI